MGEFGLVGSWGRGVVGSRGGGVGYVERPVVCLSIVMYLPSRPVPIQSSCAYSLWLTGPNEGLLEGDSRTTNLSYHEKYIHTAMNRSLRSERWLASSR